MHREMEKTIRTYVELTHGGVLAAMKSAASECQRARCSREVQITFIDKPREEQLCALAVSEQEPRPRNESTKGDVEFVIGLIYPSVGRAMRAG